MNPSHDKKYEEGTRVFFANIFKEVVEERLKEVEETAKAAAATAYHISSENIRMNKELKDDIQALSDTLKPIAEIYADVNGTWKVAKWLIIVASMVIGLIISYKQINK